LLEAVELDFSVDNALLLHLSTAVRLRRLNFSSVAVNGKPLSQYQPGSFPSLERLHVTGSLGVVSDLLRRPTSASLVSLPKVPRIFGWKMRFYWLPHSAPCFPSSLYIRPPFVTARLHRFMDVKPSEMS
jgi:hypothetical protein